MPSKNGVRKHRVIDLESTLLGLQNLQCGSGEQINLLQHTPTSFALPFCGHRGDAFLVSLRYSPAPPTGAIRRSGYREMYNAAWRATPTQQCDHPLDRGLDTPFLLPNGVFAVTVTGDMQLDDWISENKVLICLSVNQFAARWRALVAIELLLLETGRLPRDFEHPIVMLRELNCCCLCAIYQAMLQPGKCFLVL